MAIPFIGEIRLVSWSFIPRDWALCNGDLLTIKNYLPLFTLIGTRYGGDGITNFALPDLRGRVPVHAGPRLKLGTMAGTESVSLSGLHVPQHNHLMQVSNTSGASANPKGLTLAASSLPAYASGGDTVSMSSFGTVEPWRSEAHNNMQPYLCANFIIATLGMYPNQD